MEGEVVESERLKPPSVRSRTRTPAHPPLYANLAGVEIGDAFPIRVMGAINVSPESFYGGSVRHRRKDLQRLAVRMVEEGADLLDIGAMSTAPYLAGAIGDEEEAARMAAAVRAVREAVTVPISADTQRSRVAAVALKAGASIINDVSGLRSDPGMAALAAAAGGLVLMASEQRPTTAEPIAMIRGLLRAAVARAQCAGIARERIVLDPGIGFFRRASVPWHELDCIVLARLTRLRGLGHPLLVGVSRKSFVGRITGRSAPEQRLYGSLAAAAIAAYNGAAVIRAHDVAATVDVVRMTAALRAKAR